MQMHIFTLQEYIKLFGSKTAFLCELFPWGIFPAKAMYIRIADSSLKVSFVC